MPRWQTLAGALAVPLLIAGCKSPAIERATEVIGGGALPEPQVSVRDWVKPERNTEDRGFDADRAPQSWQKGDPGSRYFGRKYDSVVVPGRIKLPPTFMEDGTCLHCDGRGFRFSAEGNARDYVSCTGCGGKGRR